MRLLLSVLFLSLMFASPVAAGPPRFVTETDVDPPWTGCAFAAGAMWLDDIGEPRVRWQTVASRASSPQNGAMIGEIAEALGDLAGRRIRYSPGGGDDLTWRALVERLRDGAGAVLFGSYGKIGEPYIRWDRRFAARADDGHAVFLDRLSADGQEVFLMDPLGRGGYRGEWVPLQRVAAFAWRHPDGLVFAIAARPAPPTPEPTATPAPMVVATPINVAALTDEAATVLSYPVRGGFGSGWLSVGAAGIHPDTLSPLSRLGEPAPVLVVPASLVVRPAGIAVGPVPR
jgi:hypothetical protein